LRATIPLDLRKVPPFGTLPKSSYALSSVVRSFRGPSRRLRVEGALGSVGREAGGVEIGVAGMMRTTSPPGGRGWAAWMLKDMTDHLYISYSRKRSLRCESSISIRLLSDVECPPRHLDYWIKYFDEVYPLECSIVGHELLDPKLFHRGQYCGIPTANSSMREP